MIRSSCCACKKCPVRCQLTGRRRSIGKDSSRVLYHTRGAMARRKVW
uniref:Uncharacterized protein n=1 Tax=Phage sp. ctcqm2 TaxID=2828007 RepID=A0A8S5ST77_9VIRU|nr:MAG TPA: hypothetical protein [Phage sp. ctcqm2]